MVLNLLIIIVAHGITDSLLAFYNCLTRKLVRSESKSVKNVMAVNMSFVHKEVN